MGITAGIKCLIQRHHESLPFGKAGGFFVKDPGRVTPQLTRALNCNTE